MAPGTPVRQQKVTEPRAVAATPVFTEVLTDGNAPLLLLSYLIGLSLEHGDHLARSDWLAKDLGAWDWLKHCTLVYGLGNKLISAMMLLSRAGLHEICHVTLSPFTPYPGSCPYLSLSPSDSRKLKVLPRHSRRQCPQTHSGKVLVHAPNFLPPRRKTRSLQFYYHS